MEEIKRNWNSTSTALQFGIGTQPPLGNFARGGFVFS